MPAWAPSCKPTAAASRALLLRRLRDHFAAENILEVDTPALSQFAVSDVQIESLEVRSTLSAAPLYLHTSPEFCMKRLLAAGYPDIYSICRVFRDGESGQCHQPEFTMIEWYRHDMTLSEIARDTTDAIHAALGNRIEVAEVQTVEYLDAMTDICGLQPLTASIDELAAAAGADESLRRSVGDARDDWLDLLVATRIAPTFARDRLTVLRHYPAGQAALARLCPLDERVADRFEVFFGELELANGYVELTDANEQARRTQNDQRERAARGHPLRPLDEELIAALQHGLPGCAGVAMGLERLHMIHDDTDDIRDVVTFAFGYDND